MAVDTYYFDGSGGISDPDGVWTNDTNAFDGSTSTYATTSGSSGDNGTTNGMTGSGTNAPSSGGTITQLRARVFGKSLGLTMNAEIFSGAESLGIAIRSGATATWGSYVTLSVPTGGWTWSKVQSLEVTIYESDATVSDPRVYLVEIEVTSGYTSPFPAFRV